MMQIDGKWDDGIAFELDLLLQLADLIPVQQQLADAGLLMIEPVAVRIRGDVHLFYECLIVHKADIRILELDLAVADRFDLGSLQFQARLKTVFQKLVM